MHVIDVTNDKLKTTTERPKRVIIATKAHIRVLLLYYTLTDLSLIESNNYESRIDHELNHHTVFQNLFQFFP